MEIQYIPLILAVVFTGHLALSDGSALNEVFLVQFHCISSSGNQDTCNAYLDCLFALNDQYIQPYTECMDKVSEKRAQIYTTERVAWHGDVNFFTNQSEISKRNCVKHSVKFTLTWTTACHLTFPPMDTPPSPPIDAFPTHGYSPSPTHPLMPPSPPWNASFPTH
ncbi:hypothetical protein AVEN_17493-1 [Araneus ventricosus]|uniref:Uncharacterized protein n=1 Tax=Araneus ventricosus TaxID=182803 RepID=A0A4Y2JEF8_ARAVE|nr:hypothetical protein AVEN_17493-1 [Araneus ventricosus]